jgi:hypothetical protein
MDSIFAWIEDTALSTWVRESTSILAFPTIIVFHTIGMGLLVGANAAIDLRILGVAKSIPLKPMENFLPLLWLGLVMNVLSGIVLLLAYPTKALTNPVFYVKLTCIALALWVLRPIRNAVFRKDLVEGHTRRATMLAVASLCLWVTAITAGRLLAYTHTWVMVGIRANY